MRITIKFCLLAICGTLMTASLANGQSPSKSQKPVSSFDGSRGTFVPIWQTPMKVSLHDNLNELVQAPLFKGAGLHPDIVNLPVKDLLVPIEPQERLKIIDIQAEGQREQSSTDFRKSVAQSGLRIQSDWFPAQQVQVGEVEIRAGKHFQHLLIYPLQVSRNGSRIRKATSISYAIQKEYTRIQTPSSNKNYANNSVLQSGSWIKIGVTGTGVYRIDYDDLQNMGLNPSSLDPRTLKIHGNGGGMLTQIAGAFPHDDLVENPIWVSGQADGVMDSGDFLIFWATSPHTWDYQNSLDRWTHQFNAYSDTSYYFLTVGGNSGKRMAVETAPSGVATQTPAFTDKYSFQETNSFNPLGSGRVWLGQSYDLDPSRDYNFGISNLYNGQDVTITARLAGRSNVSSNFSIREGNTSLATVSIPNTNTSVYGGYWYRTNYKTFTAPASSVSDGSLDLEFIYSKPVTSSVGYMDYIEIEYPQQLNINNNSGYSFYAQENTGPGEIFQYNLSGGNSEYRIWDVTDPVNVREMNVSNSGSQLSFKVEADSVKRFYAFKGSAYKKPASMKSIGNQNLHGLPQAEYLIITHSNFLAASNSLAEFHRNEFGRSVNVVLVDRIFNEFSSGALDPAGIRDFIKMFYDRGLANASTMPKYVLLMGDGSYDYKADKSSGETNFVPTYQSRKSQRPTESYTSDDFYGFLDDGEGFWGEKAGLEGGVTDIMFWAEGDTVINTHGLDVAIGRMPVATPQEAENIVAKVINYISDPSGFGPWRSRAVLVADHKDADGQIHISQADSYTDDIENQQPCMNIDKVYMDNYQMENTASGSRFPDGKTALIQSLNDGSLLVNYTGHGGEVGWSNASILDISDINNLENGNRLPAYVTATCEFGRWDDPDRRSGAENMFLKESGGSIAMFTTVRVVYSGPNFYLNQKFYENVFDRDTTDNSVLPMGEVFRRTKNASWLGGINNRNFCLMGDPAMPLAYPELQTVVTSINGTAIVDSIVDTLSALSLVTIEGRVEDANGNFIPGYNGNLFVTVYDKPSQFTTQRAPYTFKWQKNRVFNGQASVANGIFSFQFVVPIDISYDNGNAKVSLYAQNSNQDGAGCRSKIYIGGSDTASISDDTPPELEIFMNDEKWADGGMTGPEPNLIATIFDENGINTVGTGIGHELTAVLDGDENNVIVLNDFYAALKDSYKEGRIEYPFQTLAVGEHTLEVKVWDVANNSQTAELTFVVADNANIALGHVLNYPNPFTTNTKFYLEHNMNDRPLNVVIKVFTVSGRLIKTLEDSFYAEGNIYCDLEWDGLDDYGDAIGRGVYVYQVLVKDESTGEKVSRFEKMVLLR